MTARGTPVEYKDPGFRYRAQAGAKILSLPAVHPSPILTVEHVHQQHHQGERFRVIRPSVQRKRAEQG